MINEYLLQFIWEHAYFNPTNLRLTTGEELQILQKGDWNKHQGPDFLAGAIRIGAARLVGNIEMHVKSSDWFKHHHQEDPHYRNVILHVVWEVDGKLPDYPTLELQSRVSKILLAHYASLMSQPKRIACTNMLQTVPEIIWRSWKEDLINERMKRKAAHIHTLLQTNHNYWEEVTWWMLARAFGSPVNAAAFELMAQSVPLTKLLREAHVLKHVEALLFGQAGFLEENFTQDYPRELKATYRHLKHKYGLSQPVLKMKMLRMRPPSFPTIRIAQLAQLIPQHQQLFHRFRTAENLDQVKSLLQCTASGYWDTHYVFEVSGASMPKQIGEAFIETIIINAVAPMVYAYGLLHKDRHLMQKAGVWLWQIKAEQNKVIEQWNTVGIIANNAGDSQGLLELYNAYCTKHRCLNCSIGCYLLNNLD